MLRSFQLFYIYLIVTAVALVLVFQQAAVAAPRKNTQAEYQALSIKLSNTGKLRVILQLAHVFPLDAALTIGNLRTTQRANIRSIQDKVLGQLKVGKLGEIRRFKTIPYLVLDVDQATLAKLRQSPDVAFIIEDILMRPTLSISSQVVGADKSVEMGFDGNGFSVAILDSGVDTSHPFLRNRVVHEACFSTTSVANSSFTVCPDGSNSQIGVGSGVNCNTSILGCDHGTHVAGIAVGQGTTFSGMAPGASFISIQVFSRFTGTTCTSAGYSSPCIFSYISDQLLALEHIYLNRDVYKIASINMSLGGGYFPNQIDCDLAYPPAKDTFDNLRAVGIAAVVAAGNDGYTDALSAPACISSAISVGATSNSNNVASYSNSAPFLTLLAPGSSINSSVPGGGFAIKSGTSMAAPHVAGAWADLRSKWPEASVDEIQLALVTLGNNITDLRNSIDKPRIQINTASTMYKHLYSGFNFAGIIPAPTVFDNYSLVQSIGDENFISRMERYNRSTGFFETVFYDMSGLPAGENGTMDSGEGWITYSKSNKLLRNYVETGCSPTSITAGVNIVSFPCIQHKVTAYDLLSISADPTGLFLVQGFASTTGRLETALITSSGEIVGSDFQLNAGESYVLQSRSDVTLPVLE